MQQVPWRSVRCFRRRGDAPCRHGWLPYGMWHEADAEAHTGMPINMWLTGLVHCCFSSPRLRNALSRVHYWAPQSMCTVRSVEFATAVSSHRAGRGLASRLSGPRLVLQISDGAPLTFWRKPSPSSLPPCPVAALGVMMYELLMCRTPYSNMNPQVCSWVGCQSFMMSEV